VDVVEAIHTRRARRALQTRPIEDEKVEALIEAARLAPSCNNFQPWRLVFVRGEEALAAVKAGMNKGNVWTTRSPLIIVVASKDEDDCMLSDRRNYFLFGCGLAIGQLVLRATELGLVAHPIAGYDPIKVRAALGIPEPYVIITTVICGYPGGGEDLLSDKQKEIEKTRPERKPVGENMFLDKWANPYPVKT
jgi:nitroreductase